MPTASKSGYHLEEKRSLIGSGATVAILHLIGWGILSLLVLPEHAAAGGNPSTVFSLAVSAYVLGIVHALDVDHIVAIDNVTRRLISLGRRPVSVGFWFALGHSSIVMLSVVLITLGLGGFASSLSDDNSILSEISGVWGATVSGLFLILLGLLNLSALRGLRSMLKSEELGSHSDDDIEQKLAQRGLRSRIWHPLIRIIDRPVKMYPVGLVFGLGLDTAASISVLVVGGLVIEGLGWYGVLILPVLFTSGMTLIDSLDGVAMSRIYRGVFVNSRQKLHYNLVVTALSVAVAFIVGGSVLISMIVELVSPDANFIDLEYWGIGLVAVFFLIWISGLLASRLIGARAPLNRK